MVNSRVANKAPDALSHFCDQRMLLILIALPVEGNIVRSTSVERFMAIVYV
jgi:hypothetical protein